MKRKIIYILFSILSISPLFSQQYTGEVNATIGTISSVSAQGVWVQYGVLSATENVNGQAILATDNAGEVGISTSSPAEKLDVYNGNVKTTWGIAASTHVYIPQTSSPTAQAEGTSFYSAQSHKVCFSTGTAPGAWACLASADSNGDTFYGPVDIVNNSTTSPVMLTITTATTPGSAVMTVSTNGYVDFLGHTKTRLFLNTAQTITNDGTDYKVNLDAVDYDNLNEFDSVNHRWKALNQGFYYAIAQTDYVDVNSGKPFTSSLKKNGTTVAVEKGSSSGIPNMHSSIVTTDILYLNPGDYLELWTSNGNSWSPTLVTGGYTYMTVFRVP